MNENPNFGGQNVCYLEKILSLYFQQNKENLNMEIHEQRLRNCPLLNLQMLAEKAFRIFDCFFCKIKSLVW
jgi:hypothetical protein